MTRDYTGIPFVVHGRDWSGCDCWGLVALVYAHELDIELPAYLDEYEQTLSADSALAIARHKGAWRRVERPACGDAVLLMVHATPQHIGIYRGSGWMLHTSRATGSIHERIGGLRWRGRIEGYYRHNDR